MRLLVLRFKLILTCVFRFLPFELCGFYVLMSVGLLVFPFINVQFVRTNFFSVIQNCI